jgi:hypothetical protein
MREWLNALIEATGLDPIYIGCLIGFIVIALFPGKGE